MNYWPYGLPYYLVRALTDTDKGLYCGNVKYMWKYIYDCLPYYTTF